MGDRVASTSNPPLMPHQEEAVEFLMKAGGRAMIADEPGLGKSRTVLEYLRRTKTRAVVVTTKSFLYGWKAEAERWWPEATVMIADRKKTAARMISEPMKQPTQLTITTYDLVWRDRTLQYGAQECVVFDESHKLANSDTKRSKAARQLATGRSSVICLTGTPQPAGQPRQLWHQMLLVGPKFLTWKAFRDRFCDPQYVWAEYVGRFVWDYTGASNVEELRRLIAPRFLRRTKALLKLPPLMVQDVPVPVKLARQREEEWAAYAARIALAKTLQTIQLVKDCVERGSKVIVFTSYKAVRDQVWSAFGESAAIITAGTPPAVRTLQVKKFQEDGSCRVFVATTQIASEALTLTAADVVVFNDLPWTPGALDQAQSRAHRKGQTKSVQVYYVQSDTSFDRVVREVLKERQAVTEEILEERLG